MQVEIKSVTQNDHEYEGRITKRKLIETSEGSYNVSEKNKSYPFIPLGFSGIADIEFSDYKGKKFIKIFKAGKGKPTQTAQKPHQQANKGFNGYAKKDPAGIALETWKQRGINYASCLKSVLATVAPSEIIVDAKKIIEVTDKFYDALCKKIDKKEEQEEPADNYEQAEVVESDIDNSF